LVLLADFLTDDHRTTSSTFWRFEMESLMKFFGFKDSAPVVSGKAPDPVQPFQAKGSDRRLDAGPRDIAPHAAPHGSAPSRPSLSAPGAGIRDQKKSVASALRSIQGIAASVATSTAEEIGLSIVQLDQQRESAGLPVVTGPERNQLARTIIQALRGKSDICSEVCQLARGLGGPDMTLENRAALMSAILHLGASPGEIAAMSHGLGLAMGGQAMPPEKRDEMIEYVLMALKSGQIHNENALAMIGGLGNGLDDPLISAESNHKILTALISSNFDVSLSSAELRKRVFELGERYGGRNMSVVARDALIAAITDLRETASDEQLAEMIGGLGEALGGPTMSGKNRDDLAAAVIAFSSSRSPFCLRGMMLHLSIALGGDEMTPESRDALIKAILTSHQSLSPEQMGGLMRALAFALGGVSISPENFDALMRQIVLSHESVSPEQMDWMIYQVAVMTGGTYRPERRDALIAWVAASKGKVAPEQSAAMRRGLAIAFYAPAAKASAGKDTKSASGATELFDRVNDYLFYGHDEAETYEKIYRRVGGGVLPAIHDEQSVLAGSHRLHDPTDGRFPRALEQTTLGEKDLLNLRHRLFDALAAEAPPDAPLEAVRHLRRTVAEALPGIEIEIVDPSRPSFVVHPVRAASAPVGEGGVGPVAPSMSSAGAFEAQAPESKRASDPSLQPAEALPKPSDPREAPAPESAGVAGSVSAREHGSA
jgi:hypothetical protein